METETTRGISPLRQRMLDDMRLRKLNPKTQSSYVRAVRNFTRYLGRSPDTATAEDLRNYQLHLVDAGTSPMSLNAAICGLKFFFDITLERGELMARMQPVRIPHRLPVVLSPPGQCSILFRPSVHVLKRRAAERGWSFHDHLVKHGYPS
jgi:integrase/recombinase XerD